MIGRSRNRAPAQPGQAPRPAEMARSRVLATVCERVVLKPRNGRSRMPALAAEHVVPLKDLVENDSVHKPAETDAQQDSGDAWTCDSLGIPARSKVRTGSVCRVDGR
jgi:hypothetical protein